MNDFPGGASDDRLHALVHRGPLLELHDDYEYVAQEDGSYLTEEMARWPKPFDDNNLDNKMWWDY